MAIFNLRRPLLCQNCNLYRCSSDLCDTASDRTKESIHSIVKVQPLAELTHSSTTQKSEVLPSKQYRMFRWACLDFGRFLLFGRVIENLSSALEPAGSSVGRMVSRVLRMYAEQANSSRIAKGGSAGDVLHLGYGFNASMQRDSVVQIAINGERQA